MNDTAETRSGKRRRIRNMLLEPMLQMKFGIVSIGLTLTFCIVISAILYVHLSKFTAIIVELTGVEEEVVDLLNSYLAQTQLWVILTLVGFLAANIGFSIFYTHRLVGPTYAFRKHIQQITAGNFLYKTSLREKDAFSDLARDLNHLSDHLQGQQQPNHHLESNG